MKIPNCWRWKATPKQQLHRQTGERVPHQVKTAHKRHTFQQRSSTHLLQGLEHCQGRRSTVRVSGHDARNCRSARAKLLQIKTSETRQGSKRHVTHKRRLCVAATEYDSVHDCPRGIGVLPDETHDATHSIQIKLPYLLHHVWS